MFQCSNNSIEYTFSHPQNSYKDPKEVTERIDYILYKFNKRNSVSLFFISYEVVHINIKRSKINILTNIIKNKYWN